MKKIFAAILAMTTLCCSPVTGFAAKINQDSTAKTVNAQITTAIAPTYTVSIPANATVAFNAETTDFGQIEVTAAQIDPDKCIKVSLTTDGKLNNKIDSAKVIPYTVNSESTPFTSATYFAAGDKTDLSIHILSADWNKAYAGQYEDTVTFEVSYVNR